MNMVSKPSIKDSTALIVAAILVVGTISTIIPTAFAQSEYNYVPQQQYKGYEDSYGKDYDKKKASNLNKQNVNCNNIIINEGDSTGQDTAGGDMINGMANGEEGDGTGQWVDNGEKKNLNDINNNIVNFCKNKNFEVVEAAAQNGLNVGSLYIVEGPVEIPPSDEDDLAESIASCDEGDFVISGGFSLNPGGIHLNNFNNIQSNPTSDLTGWSASITSDTVLASIQATAICFDAQ